MLVDSDANPASYPPQLDARGSPASCASYPQIRPEFSSKLAGWGGARENSGGPRANSGGARAGAGRPRNLVRLMPVRDAFRWYCVRTDRGAEVIADRELCEADFTVFAPTIWKPAEEMRRYTNGSIRRARPDRVVPMFRRYLFVRLNLTDPSWHVIKDLPGVEYLLCSAPSGPGLAGLPIALPDEAIQWIRGLLASNGCLYPPDYHNTPIEAGTEIRMAAGPLAERAAICKLSDGKRVVMMMSLFNREVPVTTMQSAVEVM